MEKLLQGDYIFIDFAKAFNSFEHEIILYQLSNFGICVKKLCWRNSYLEYSTQKLRIERNKCNPILLTSADPQWCNLGPPLFILFNNDIYDEDVNLSIVMNTLLDASVTKRFELYYFIVLN